MTAPGACQRTADAPSRSHTTDLPPQSAHILTAATYARLGDYVRACTMDQLSHRVFALAATGQLGMATAAEPIRLAVASHSRFVYFPVSTQLQRQYPAKPAVSPSARPGLWPWPLVRG
jgi:hypothetical protein